MQYEIKHDSLDAEESSEPLISIPTIDNTVSYNYFFTNFLLKNKPCVIKNVASKWESYNLWGIENAPNFAYLSEKYGELDGTVYKCNEQYYNSQKTEDTKFGDFLTYWESYIQSGYPITLPLLYLKDWHLKNLRKDDQFYEVPIFFASDWLNEYLVNTGNDDYRFVYMGPKNTWTPFHSDVLSSFSWSVNILGQKKWIFVPPGQENELRDKLGNLPHDILQCSNPKTTFLEVIQDRGDAIFVPSGWHHQVWNLRDTISINHNWINGCNILTMWDSLVNELNKVKKEISDCKKMDNFNEQCQIVLKASHGMNYYDFCDFILFIAKKRLSSLENNKWEPCFHGGVLGKNHCVFDLRQIQKVLDLINQNEDVKFLEKIVNKSDNPEKISKNIHNCLKDKEIEL